jgi:lysozyme
MNSKTTNRRRKKKDSLWLLLAFLLVCGILYLLITFRPSFLFPQWKNFNVFGIDVSKYQGNIDWYQLKNHEVDFAFMKATEGSKLVDRNFKKNWSNCRNVGVIRGAYHFYSPRVPWNLQANNFIETVELEPGDLPPVIDIELVHSKNQEYLVREIKKWLEVVERHYGVKPIVYTYENYYNRFLQESFRGYNLWIAKYSNESPKLIDGARWEFWQYSESGKLVGIDHTVDLNCFFGSREQFNKIRKK